MTANQRCQAVRPLPQTFGVSQRRSYCVLRQPRSPQTLGALTQLRSPKCPIPVSSIINGYCIADNPGLCTRYKCGDDPPDAPKPITYSAGTGGVGIGSLRWIGLACAAWGRPSTGGFVNSNGSGTDFCCTAVFVQPRNAPPMSKIQAHCRNFRAISRFSLSLFRGSV